MLNKAKAFIWSHRGKLAITSALAVLGAGFYWYITPTASSIPEEEEDPNLYAQFFKNEGISPTSMGSKKLALKQGVRSKLLLRVRRHFDIAGRHFFPTLRMKLIEEVDISNAVSQIKQLRLSGMVDITSKSTEANLWEQIKVSAFCMAMSSAYSVAIVATVLRIQLHILARNASFYNDDENSHTSPSESELKLLIDSTFKYIFGEGMKNLVDALRAKVACALVDWTVREKVAIQFIELVDVISYIRKNIEKDMRSLVEMTISG